MSGEGSRYGYLALQRVYGGVAKMPDGSEEFFESYEAAQKARNEWEIENRLAKAKAKAEKDRREFVEGCSVEEERIKQPGLLTPDLIKRIVRTADGEDLGYARAQAFDTVVEKAALERFPEPTPLSLADSLAGGVERIVVWAASLYLEGEPRQLPAFPSWDFGLPIESVLKVLNEVAADGWRVVHVSEDRGVFRGITNQTDAAVTKARYLLARDP